MSKYYYQVILNDDEISEIVSALCYDPRLTPKKRRAYVKKLAEAKRQGLRR